MYCDPDLATDVYTRQCSLRVSARDLAVMGATLANGGVNPVTGEQAIDTRYCKRVLAVLATAGPLRAFWPVALRRGAPRQERSRRRHRDRVAGQGGDGHVLPAARCGRQQRAGQHVTRYLSEALGLNLFASAPFT
jgi:glutaminase